MDGIYNLTLLLTPSPVAFLTHSCLDFSHKNFSTTFADRNSTTDLIIAEGDLAIILTGWKAIYQGKYLGIPPTNKQVTHRQVDLSV